jgi:superfamily II DNA or RNA helicase
MSYISDASNVLATCYPLTCNSEEYASDLLATQKRREEESLKAPSPSQAEGYPGTITLRPYQALAVQNLRQSLARGAGRLMLCSPTGSGKTEIGMALVKGARSKHKRVAFLCNRIHLVNQTSRRFAKSKISHGVIQGENTRNIYEPVLVGSIQTVARRGLPEVDLLIIDEAHTVAGSKEYRAVIAAAKCPVIGLSATPYARGLGKHYAELGGPLFEQMVIAATIPELIADGFLVDCDIYAPSEPNMTGIKQSRNAFGEMDYSDADVGRATDKPELIGDIVKHWFKLAKGTPTVCFASNISHSKHIVEQFRAAGVAAEHIDCYTDEDERKAILARMESGETLIISNVGILAEGWDFPACRTLILARPTRSLIRYMLTIAQN